MPLLMQSMVGAILIGTWKKFQDAPKGTNRLLVVMCIVYLVGPLLIKMAKAETW